MFVLVKPFRLSPCPTPFPLPHTRVEFCLGQTTTSWSVLMTYLSDFFGRLIKALGLAFAFAFGLKAFK